MQSCEEVFGPLEHIFVELGRVMTWHTLVPDVDDDENILNSHAL